MYEEQGGACGEGYELVTVKVLGASCVCVSDSCKDGAKPEGAREVRTDAERSFGKQVKTEDAAPAGDPGSSSCSRQRSRREVIRRYGARRARVRKWRVDARS